MINLASPPSASSYSLLSIRSEKRNRSPTHSGPSTKRKPLATITGSSPGLMIASMAGSSRSTPVIFASGAASAAGFAPVSGAAGEQAARARPDTKARPIVDFMCRYSSCYAGPATAAPPRTNIDALPGLLPMPANADRLKTIVHSLPPGCQWRKRGQHAWRGIRWMGWAGAGAAAQPNGGPPVRPPGSDRVQLLVMTAEA